MIYLVYYDKLKCSTKLIILYCNIFAKRTATLFSSIENNLLFHILTSTYLVYEKLEYVPKPLIYCNEISKLTVSLFSEICRCFRIFTVTYLVYDKMNYILPKSLFYFNLFAKRSTSPFSSKFKTIYFFTFLL